MRSSKYVGPLGFNVFLLVPESCLHCIALHRRLGRHVSCNSAGEVLLAVGAWKGGILQCMDAVKLLVCRRLCRTPESSGTSLATQVAVSPGDLLHEAS